MLGNGAIAKTFRRRRGVRNSEYPPPLPMSRIVRWAKQHRKHTGQWTTVRSGPIADASGKRWHSIDLGAAPGNSRFTRGTGHRGLHGGSSLAKLLDEKRPK
jgi:hypothetical protein